MGGWVWVYGTVCYKCTLFFAPAVNVNGANKTDETSRIMRSSLHNGRPEAHW